MKVNVDLAQTEVMETQSAVTHTHTQAKPRATRPSTQFQHSELTRLTTPLNPTAHRAREKHVYLHTFPLGREGTHRFSVVVIHAAHSRHGVGAIHDKSLRDTGKDVEPDTEDLFSPTRSVRIHPLAAQGTNSFSAGPLHMDLLTDNLCKAGPYQLSRQRGGRAYGRRRTDQYPELGSPKAS